MSGIKPPSPEKLFAAAQKGDMRQLRAELDTGKFNDTPDAIKTTMELAAAGNHAGMVDALVTHVDHSKLAAHARTIFEGGLEAAAEARNLRPIEILSRQTAITETALLRVKASITGDKPGDSNKLLEPIFQVFDDAISERTSPAPQIQRPKPKTPGGG